MNKQLTLSIGIPAYNEEANIGVLLSYLLRQKQTYTTLKKIVVVSDGSTDRTVEVARSLKDKRIVVIDRKKRLGMNKTQNEILSNIDTEVLIMLNGDVIPVDKHLLNHLIKPIIVDPNVGIVGGNTTAVSSHTLVEWALNAGHQFKQNLYFRLNRSETLYLCHGRVRAFTKPLYTQLEWPEHCPEDAYSFLRCYELGYKFVYSRPGTIQFRSPQTIEEHAKQSLRFHHGQDTLLKYFPKAVVAEAYFIPKTILFRTFLWYFSLHPFSMTAYVIITLLTRFVYTKEGINITKWEVARSSKQVV